MKVGDVIKYRHGRWTVLRTDADTVTVVQYRPTMPSIRTAHIDRADIPGLKLSGELQIKTRRMEE